MFESLALENPRNTARRWTTALSFALEAVAIGLLILIPLGYTEGIALRLGEPFSAPSYRGRPEVTELTERKPHASSNVTHTDATVYRRIPIRVDMSPDRHPRVFPEDYTPETPDIIGAIPTGTSNSTVRHLLDAIKPHVAGPPPLVHSALRVSHLDSGMLIRQVKPIYPKIAQATRTEGSVVLAALIDTQGRITQLHALSGHPLLIPAAIDAVQQWRYRPYILNGVPMEVETQITVVFTLQH